MDNYLCFLQDTYKKGKVLSNRSYFIYDDIFNACLDPNVKKGYHLYEVKSLAMTYVTDSGAETNQIEIIKKLTNDDISYLSKLFFNNYNAMTWLLSCFNYNEQFLEEYIVTSLKHCNITKVDYSCEGDYERSLMSISRTQNLSEEFIKKYSNVLYLYNIYKYQNNISNNFKDEFIIPNMSWDEIPLHSIDDEFIIKFKDKLDWNSLCKYNKLSENVIGKCQTKLNSNHWKSISSNEYISEVVLMKNQDKIFWNLVSKRGNLSDMFKVLFKDKL